MSFEIDNVAWKSLLQGNGVGSVSSSTISAVATLNELIAGCTAEFVVLSVDDRELAAESIHQAISALVTMPAAVVCICKSLLDTELSARRCYPARFAALLCRTDTFPAMIFRRTALLRHDPFRAVDSPLRDWLIRATLAEADVCVSALPEDAASPALPEVPLPALAPCRPGHEQDWLHAHLRHYCGSISASSPDSAEAIALQAGLYQWHDFLAESHELSQTIEGRGQDQLGDYWHAIMHRREPDYSNAKYWFRRIGRQPIFVDLARSADRILRESAADPQAERWRSRLLPAGEWNAAAFVNLCEACETASDPLSIAARRIQKLEMELLMKATYVKCPVRRPDLPRS